MKHKFSYLIGSVFFLIGIIPLNVSSQPVTTGSLIKEMTDLKVLAEYPENSYQNIQFSSYDRRSDRPDGPGWYQNSDGFGGEPIPNFKAVLEEPGDDGIGTYLICDVDGPGAIVRGWTARMEGKLRVFLDGAEEPIYEGSAERFLRKFYYSYLDQMRADSTTLEGSFKQRDAGYFPVPFAQNLRVEWTGNIENLHFYELQIRKYSDGAEVRTFQPSDLKTYHDEIVKAAEILKNPETLSANMNNRKQQKISAQISEDSKKEVLNIKGERMVRQLALKLKADDLDKALRQTILEIKFDGASWGQVQSPVGDFFGAAPGINPFSALPFTVQPDGSMICRFVMPFKKSMQVFVHNMGDQNVEITGSVQHEPYVWDESRSMYFQAHWRTNHNLNPYFPYDLPFLSANGKGVYVGTSSLLFNPIEIPTPGGNWWGEGDEKIFVDDKSFPSIFGTGSEDYYNYSWSSPDIFQFAYAGQPRNDGPGNRGFVTNHRWHILDPIPFEKQLQFFMEMFSHTNIEGFSYARLSYLYARPGLKDDHIPISKEDVRVNGHHKWSPESAGAASNSVFYQTETLVNDEEKTDIKKDNLWAEGTLFVWHPQEGDKLKIPFKIKENGKYKLWFTAAKLPHSGKISVTLDGKNAGFGGNDMIDLSSPHRRLLRNYGSEIIELTEGKHTLDVRFEQQESSGNQNEIGIDFIWVQNQ